MTEDKELKKAVSLANIPSFDVKDLSPAQLQLIKNTVAKGATDDELQFFLYQCHAQGLNPFLKEIWFVKRVSKQKQSDGYWDYPRLANGEIDYSKADLTIMTSVDGYFKKASENPDFALVQSMEVRANDDFEMVFENEKFVVKKHSFKSKDRGEIMGAWAFVQYKSGLKDWNYVEFEEYSQKIKDKSGNTIYTGSWKSNPTAMIKNRAMAPLLKKAGKLSGIYTEEEMANVIEADKVLDNSPATSSIRENEIEKILKKIDAVQTMEQWKVVAAEISEVAGGLLKEDQAKIRAAASIKVDDLQAGELDKVQKQAEADLIKKQADLQTTLPDTDAK